MIYYILLSCSATTSYYYLLLASLRCVEFKKHRARRSHRQTEKHLDITREKRRDDSGGTHRVKCPTPRAGTVESPEVKKQRLLDHKAWANSIHEQTELVVAEVKARRGVEARIVNRLLLRLTREIVIDRAGRV